MLEPQDRQRRTDAQDEHDCGRERAEQEERVADGGVHGERRGGL